MSTVNITINGEKISAEQGMTVLEAARSAGIDIPTLCHHPSLKPIGACRLCLVEIARQRSLQPACTFPATEGMVIQTESPKVVEARKFVLELLFSERNHFCMYCESSGECELQTMGYRYGLDHWVYPSYQQKFEADATSPYFIMDHNRCILCRRCVRACSELAANSTLDISMRGPYSTLSADMHQPIGTSSCIVCGVCMDVCPTGTISDKRSAFMGTGVLTDSVKSVCHQCSVGCEMRVIKRGEQILRIQGQWDSAVSRGMLCKKGRFDPLYDLRQRIKGPLLRASGEHQSADWDTAAARVKQLLSQYPAEKTGLLLTTKASNETFQLVRKTLVEQRGIDNIALLNAVPPVIPGNQGELSDIAASDLIVIVGADPVNNQPVASFMIKRAIDLGASLLLVEIQPTGLTPFADTVIAPAEIDKALQHIEQANNPLVIYGAELDASCVEVLKKAGEKAKMLVLQSGSNTMGALSQELNRRTVLDAAELVLVIIGEDAVDEEAVLKQIPNNAVMILQTAYYSELCQRADIVLPSAIWCESSGTLTNTEGKSLSFTQAVNAPELVKTSEQILSLLI